MIILLLFFVSGLQASVGAEIAYSRACASGQCGDWQKAQQRMSGLVIDNPDRAELLYDNGVAAFRLQEFEKAAAYFDEVTKKSDTSARLKEQAHFNLGNTQVALNELPKAIMQYEAALAIDPKDERAKHNLEKVRALLAQQQQEQKEEEKNQDGDSQSKQDKQQQKQGANQDKDKQQKQESGGSSDQQKSGDQQEQQSSQGKGEQSEQQKDSSEQKDNGASQSDKQGDEEDKADGKSAGQDQDGKQDQFGNGHEDSPESDEKKSDAHNVASQQDKKQDSADQKEDQEGGRALSAADDPELDKDRRAQDEQKMQKKFAPHEQWMARLLQKQDKADERANKQLI